MADSELDAIVRVQGAMYHALFDSAPLGYFVLDTRGKIHDVNELGLDLLRTSREHALGESLDAFVGPLSRAVLQTHLERVMDLRATQRCRLRLQGRGPGDREVEVVSRLAPEQVNGGEFVFLTMTELTEQTEWATRLADLGRFASWIAHELRQPLSSLKLAVYNIGKKCREPDVGVHLKHADDQITQANQIITDVVALSALTPPRAEEIDLRKLIDACIDDMESSLPTARIRFIRGLDALAGIPATVDPDQIRQVARNLFQNACEALGDKDEAGTIVVRGFLSDGSIGFSVTDTDDGIEKHRGVGLGLSLALELVRMNGGSLSMDSTPGSGTTVTVTLRRPERDGDPPKSQ